ncbi:MAG: hypothetical protein ACI9CE_001137 [Flavobacterium sp.]|jgi:hypothetical protein
MSNVELSDYRLHLCQISKVSDRELLGQWFIGMRFTVDISDKKQCDFLWLNVCEGQVLQTIGPENFAPITLQF